MSQRRVALIVIGIITGTLVIVCGGILVLAVKMTADMPGPSPSEAATVAPAPVPIRTRGTPPPYVSLTFEDAFVETLKKEPRMQPMARDLSHEELVGLGILSCQFQYEEPTFLDGVRKMVKETEGEVNTEQASFMAGAAMGAFCPSVTTSP